MVGYGANKGIVPMACEEIFERIGKNTDEGLEYDVVVSMLEIYNEKVHDLLIDATKRTPAGLEIREQKVRERYPCHRNQGIPKRIIGTEYTMNISLKTTF